MVTNYYNASNNFSAPIRREPKPYVASREACPEKTECTPAIEWKKEQVQDKDTLLILGLIFFLFMSGCEDTLLLLALGYLLFF